MRVIGFNGSPRKEGSTAFLVDKILEGAREAGAATRIFQLNEMAIKPCQSCFGCKRGSLKCGQKDDMAMLYDEIDQADAIVLGTPLYMWQMSAQAKTFTDRLFAFFGSEMNSRIKGKPLVFAVNHGNADSGIFRSYLDYTKGMFGFLGFDPSVFVIGDTEKRALDGRVDAFAEMKKVGTALAGA